MPLFPVPTDRHRCPEYINKAAKISGKKQIFVWNRIVEHYGSYLGSICSECVEFKKTQTISPVQISIKPVAMLHLDDPVKHILEPFRDMDCLKGPKATLVREWQTAVSRVHGNKEGITIESCETDVFVLWEIIARFSADVKSACNCGGDAVPDVDGSNQNVPIEDELEVMNNDEFNIYIESMSEDLTEEDLNGNVSLFCESLYETFEERIEEWKQNVAEHKEFKASTYVCNRFSVFIEQMDVVVFDVINATINTIENSFKKWKSSGGFNAVKNGVRAELNTLRSTFRSQLRGMRSLLTVHNLIVTDMGAPHRMYGGEGH